jgi:hypothetical protein
MTPKVAVLWWHSRRNSRYLRRPDMDFLHADLTQYETYGALVPKWFVDLVEAAGCSIPRSRPQDQRTSYAISTSWTISTERERNGSIWTTF